MLIIHCAICGKEVKIFPCRKGITKCCSYECRNKLIAKTKKVIYETNTNRSYIKDICILPKEMVYNGYKVYMNGKYPAICINGKNKHLHYIVMYGNKLTEQYLKEWLYIIRILTGEIGIWKI